MSTPSRRRVATLATTAALALGMPVLGTTVLAGPAQSADPVEDCVAAFPVADLEAGDEVDGLTVVSGTTPTAFTGEVLGVLEDGIGPDLDMVMMELDMPAFASTGGIWQGMSGSPVYAGDGRLIGAVAYGLAYGPSPIAGITPFEDMDTYLTAPSAGRVALGGAAARTVAARAGITTRQAQQGFRELPMPMGVNGLTSRRLAQVQAKGPDFVEKSTYVMGRASGSAAGGAETVFAGGNLAASVAYGDVSMAGVGTATSVCDGRVVGFGHPLALLGSTTEALHSADAIYVQPDSLGAPFKVANLGPVVGTITDDRLTGITGTFGVVPDTTAVSSTLTHGATTRTGTTAVSVGDFLADATLYQLVGNHDRVLDGPAKGSELQTWAITGTENGKPFSLTYTDRYTSTDLSFEIGFGLGELVWRISSMEGVEVTSVTAKGAVTDTLARHSVSTVQQQRGGTWVTVTKKAPAVAKAGGTVRLRVVLGGTAGSQVIALSPITLPKRAAGKLVLAVQGGNSAYDSPSGSTVAKIKDSISGLLRHDQIRLQLGTAGEVSLGYGGDYEELMLEKGRKPSRPAQFVRVRTSAPLAHVVDGTKRLKLVIR